MKEKKLKQYVIDGPSLIHDNRVYIYYEIRLIWGVIKTNYIEIRMYFIVLYYDQTSTNIFLWIHYKISLK